MNKITINTDSSESTIYVGLSIHQAGEFLKKYPKRIIITDTHVHEIYGHLFPKAPVIITDTGEKNKTLETIEFIFEKFLKYEVDRSWFVLGIGGGIVCDMAGFAASIFMRGLPFAFVSTTLLSQVDASVGGKNGVNFEGYKNMVGVFSQPEFVICDVDVLKSLERRDFYSGFAEIVKAGAINDISLFEYLESNAKLALEYDGEVLQELIYKSVLIKAAVVEADEKEKGERRKLNFGHTFAHSFEKHLGITHGEAVSIGMVLASKLSHKLGLIGEDEVSRLSSLLRQLNLPVQLDFNWDIILSGIKKDKKREGDFIHMILLESLGKAIIKKISIKQLEELAHGLHFGI